MSSRRTQRVCRDRCEVCEAVLEQRPVPELRRCADHLDQLDLLSTEHLRRLSSPRTS